MADPDVTSVFDPGPDAPLEARLDVQAEAEIDAGKGVPHVHVRAWLTKLADGARVAPPEA